jgi:signal transduction histidine kinase
LTRLKQLERTREEFIANVSHGAHAAVAHQGYAKLLGGAKDDPDAATRFLQPSRARSGATADRRLLTISNLNPGE